MRSPLVCSLLVTSIFMLDGKTDVKVTTTQGILLNATFGLLGMLGFIINDLAIIRKNWL